MLKLLMCSIDFVVTAGAAVGAACLVFLVFLITIDVLLRYLLNSMIPSVMSFSSLIMAIVMFLSFAYAQANKQNIAVDFFINKFVLSRRSKQNWNILNHIATLMFFGVIFWESIDIFKVSFQIGEFFGGGAIRVMIWPARGALLLGCFLMIVQVIKDLYVIVTTNNKER